MEEADTREFVCEEGGARIDVYLAAMVSTSRNKVQQAIHEDRVRINGAVVDRASRRTIAGEKISIALAVERPLLLEPQPLPLDIVFEDEFLIVLNKAAGMPVHPGAGRPSGTLVNALLHHAGGRQGAGLSSGGHTDSIRPGIVHRLDMDTSGLMVVAKNDDVHRKLQMQFEARTIERQYAGIVWGIPEPMAGTIDHPIGRDVRVRTRMAARTNGKPAVTQYESIDTYAHAALVRFRLQTGRTHQIRVHALHMNHPVMGDPVYRGNTIRSGPVTGRRKAFFRHVFERLPRQALHARKLGFVHPGSGQAMSWEQPLPPDMTWVLKQLRKDPA